MAEKKSVPGGVMVLEDLRSCVRSELRNGWCPDLFGRLYQYATSPVSAFQGQFYRIRKAICSESPGVQTIYDDEK